MSNMNEYFASGGNKSGYIFVGAYINYNLMIEFFFEDVLLLL